MEKQTVTVGKITLTGKVAQAFEQAQHDLAQALAQAHAEETPTVDQAIDRLAAIDTEQAPVEQEKKNLRNVLKANLRTGERVTTAQGNTALSFAGTSRTFDYRALDALVQAAKDRGDTRTLGTLQRVLTECVKLGQTHNLKINP